MYGARTYDRVAFPPIGRNPVRDRGLIGSGRFARVAGLGFLGDRLGDITGADLSLAPRGYQQLVSLSVTLHRSVNAGMKARLSPPQTPGGPSNAVAWRAYLPMHRRNVFSVGS